MLKTNGEKASVSEEKGLSVFEFTDYREFLKAYYEFKKRTHPAFSYRQFALKAKINSSGFYKNVVDGKRSLGRSLIVRFSEAMKLRKKEAEYFESMVYFNEAKTMEEKRIYFERMMSLRKLDAFLVESSQFEFYSKWYYSAVRELIGMIRFKGDFPALARLLNPSIRPDQAEKAVRVLEDLKFIAKDGAGIYRLVQNVITTGPEVASLNVANYQIACMDLAKEAFDRHEPEVRDISTLTLSLSKETFELFKEEIISFRKRLLALEQKIPKADRVYQLNTQFFPLSKNPLREKT
ncbi:MAG: hypothetical protein JWO30_818 [Fibrobacteres bacterium]|nr:hypothetical protein [Fibrobacterota bacterium]